MDCDALRDDQRERIKGSVPGGTKGKRGHRTDNRKFLDAQMWMSGEGIFRADQGMNGGGMVDLPTYNAEIERFFSQRRSPALSQLPGALLPPK